MGITLALLLLAPLPGWARQDQAVRAEGCATVIGGDVAQARDEAVIAARVKALAQAAAGLVDADILAQHRMLLEAVVRTQAAGYLQADRIVADAPRPDGAYCVRIQAWAIPAELKERLPSLVSELAIVVVLPETNMAAPSAPAVAEGEIVQRLGEANYRVLHPQQVGYLRKRAIADALRRGDPAEARRLGLRMLANVIITGEAKSEFSQNNAGVISAHARGAVRAIEAETGRSIATFSQQDVRGFALSDDQAGRRALAEFGRAAAAGLLARLDAHVQQKDRLIEVRVRGLADEKALARFQSFLQALRWVQDVQQQSFSPAESVLNLTYPEKTVYLAARIGREPGYRLVEFDRSRIVIHVTGTKLSTATRPG